MSSTYSLFLYLPLLVVAANACSILPNVPSYSVTERTILSPIVVHGRVLNTTYSRSNRYKYRACIYVLKVIKGDKNLPREMCFGDFGAEELCLTSISTAFDYIFYMTSDKQANYNDGEPKSSAIVANGQTVRMAERGVCDPSLSQSSSCRRPTISRGSDFKSIVRVQEGQTAEMVCRAKGSSPLVVVWNKRGAVGWQHTTRHSSSTLRLSRVTISDMGVYECNIWNPAGQTRALVRLFVDSLPCGRFLFLMPGQRADITSPYYPKPYRKDKMCSWRICPSQRKRVKLEFKDFNLRESYSDDVQIYHECQPERSTLKYCGSSSPGELVSKCASRCIQIWFRSQGDRTIGLPNQHPGFHAIATASDEETALFDYRRLYCNNDLLFKFIPKEINYRAMVGHVVHSFKNSRVGRDITLSVENRFFIKGLFGCQTKVQLDKEAYVGATEKTPGLFEMNFAAPAKSQNIPKNFDAELNRLKITPPKC